MNKDLEMTGLQCLWYKQMLKGYKLLGTGKGDRRRGSRYRSSEPMSGKSGEDVGNGDVPSPRSRFRHFRIPKPVITCLSTVLWLILHISYR